LPGLEEKRRTGQAVNLEVRKGNGSLGKSFSRQIKTRVGVSKNGQSNPDSSLPMFKELINSGRNDQQY
jgi:hypothetical protein